MYEGKEWLKCEREKNEKLYREKNEKLHREKDTRHEDRPPLFNTIQLAGSQCYTTAVTSAEKNIQTFKFSFLTLK